MLRASQHNGLCPQSTKREMKTPLTQPDRPSDIIARWTLLEERLTGDHEAMLCALTRHIALGCSLCRQEEIIGYLTLWPNLFCTMPEALFLIDWLMVQYLTSSAGKKEMGLLHSGKMPVFFHTDTGPSVNDGFLSTPDV